MTNQPDDQNRAAYLFLSGADMDPTAVRAAYPGGRFLARARIGVDADEVGPPFGGYLADDVWGIVIQLAEGDGDARAPREVVTDDGRRFRAAVPADGLLSGEPEAVLAEARYWELPPDYVVRLREAIAAQGAATGDDE